MKVKRAAREKADSSRLTRGTDVREHSIVKPRGKGKVGESLVDPSFVFDDKAKVCLVLSELAEH